MSWITSMIVALLSGAAGLFLAGFIANACVSWYHVSSREGGAGYFVLFVGLAGGLVGVGVGLLTARMVAATYAPGFFPELAGSLAIILIMAGAAAFLCRFLADVPPTLDGQRLNLEVEFRFPLGLNPALPPTADGEWQFWLGSIAGHMRRASEVGQIRKGAARFEDGRWILPSEVSLFTERGQRSIALQNGDRNIAGFLVPLPARPGKSFEEWSDWLPRQSADGQPWPAEKMSYRFRIRKEVPQTPPVSYETQMSEQAERAEAEFAAIPSDAPIKVWLSYLHSTFQKDRALTKIVSRPNLGAELTELVLGDDAGLAAATLRFVACHPRPTVELLTPVQAAGRDLAERIRKVNATPVQADPSYLGAADVSIRFSGWMEAARLLREKCGGDFSAELQTILQLSRIRADSHVMTLDVCRVASYHLQQWTGAAPLESDPKPR